MRVSSVMDSISKGVKNNGEYDMWLTPYISNISKCENASKMSKRLCLQQICIKEMVKITNSRKKEGKKAYFDLFRSRDGSFHIFGPPEV